MIIILTIKIFLFGLLLVGMFSKTTSLQYKLSSPRRQWMQNWKNNIWKKIAEAKAMGGLVVHEMPNDKNMQFMLLQLYKQLLESVTSLIWTSRHSYRVVGLRLIAFGLNLLFTQQDPPNISTCTILESTCKLDCSMTINKSNLQKEFLKYSQILKRFTKFSKIRRITIKTNSSTVLDWFAKIDKMLRPVTLIERDWRDW